MVYVKKKKKNLRLLKIKPQTKKKQKHTDDYLLT